jgi:hypothetical protein
MALEEAGVPARSLYQSLAYNDYVPEYRAKLDLLKPIDRLQGVSNEFNVNESALDSMLNSIDSKAVDNEDKIKHINYYKSKLDEINNLEDPYEQLRQTKRLGKDFASKLQDSNTPLGKIVVNKQRLDAGLKQIKEHEDKGDPYHVFNLYHDQKTINPDGTLNDHLPKIQKIYDKENSDTNVRNDILNELAADETDYAMVNDAKLKGYNVQQTIKELTDKKIDNYIDNQGGLDRYKQHPTYRQQSEILQHETGQSSKDVDAILRNRLRSTGYEKIFHQFGRKYSIDEMAKEDRAAKTLNEANAQPYISGVTSVVPLKDHIATNLTDYSKGNTQAEINKNQEIIDDPNATPLHKAWAKGEIANLASTQQWNQERLNQANEKAGRIKPTQNAYQLINSATRDVRGVKYNPITQYLKDTKVAVNLLDNVLKTNTPISNSVPGLTGSQIRQLNSLAGFTPEVIDKANDFLKTASDNYSVQLPSTNLTPKLKGVMESMAKDPSNYALLDEKTGKKVLNDKKEDLEFHTISDTEHSGTQIFGASLIHRDDKGKEIGRTAVKAIPAVSTRDSGIRDYQVKELLGSNSIKAQNKGALMSISEYTNQVNDLKQNYESGFHDAKKSIVLPQTGTTFTIVPNTDRNGTTFKILTPSGNEVRNPETNQPIETGDINEIAFNLALLDKVNPQALEGIVRGGQNYKNTYKVLTPNQKAE